ncbi:MAG: hypothetical protein MZV70_60755 [Desulfobacterales bacterium]|nr:hypothetical protein [Desulfobacterales bacterium]
MVNADDFGISEPRQRRHRPGPPGGDRHGDLPHGGGPRLRARPCRLPQGVAVAGCGRASDPGRRTAAACRSDRSLTGDDGRFPASAGAFTAALADGTHPAGGCAGGVVCPDRARPGPRDPGHAPGQPPARARPAGARSICARELAARYGIPFVRVPVEDLRAGPAAEPARDHPPAGRQGPAALLGALARLAGPRRSGTPAAALPGVSGRRPAGRSAACGGCWPGPAAGRARMSSCAIPDSRRTSRMCSAGNTVTKRSCRPSPSPAIRSEIARPGAFSFAGLKI